MQSLVRGTVAQVTRCASRSLCLTSPRMHSHPYFADEGWQPGEVRTRQQSHGRSSDLSVPGGHVWPSSSPLEAGLGWIWRQLPDRGGRW